MAIPPNPNNPFGFRPVMRTGGSPFSTTEYGKAAADTNTIFMFDMVCRSTGTAPPIPERPDRFLAVIESGYAGTPGTSLWMGASMNYGAPSTGTPHMVTDEVDCIYIAQLKTGTLFSTTSHAQKNANISLTTPGNALTKQSGMTVDGATIGTTASEDLRIQRLAMIGNNQEGQNCSILEITINKHYFAQGSVAV